MEKPNRLEEKPVVEPSKELAPAQEIITEGITPLQDMGGGYVEYDGKLFQKDALKELRPDLFRVKVDSGNEISTDFGTQFPKMARKGQIFVRVDVLPNRVFKFDGKKWLEQNKNSSQSYLYNKEYIEFLIERIGTGEYDLEVLSDDERAEIEVHLKGNQNS